MVAIVSPLWRWLVTDLAGAGITTLDKLATERTVTPMLNAPMQITGTVPSDDPSVNSLHTDNLPFLAEGVRQLYCFRRESDVVPYYTIRGAGLILQTDDASRSEDARTRFTAWDPWQYLMASQLFYTDGEGCFSLPRKGQDFPVFTNAFADEVILDWLYCSYYQYSSYPFSPGAPDASANFFLDWGQYAGGAYYGGTIESSPMIGTLHLAPGTSLGQGLQEMAATGCCDIVITPIYDPVNRPGILGELSIYAQDPNDPDSGAGRRNYEAVFAWDRPGRSLVGFDDLIDGSERANYIQFRTGLAGAKMYPAVWNDGSIGRYGGYYTEQTFTGGSKVFADFVASLAAEQLVLRADYKQTLTVNPAPERSPEPFVDYYIGDTVPVFIGTAQRGVYQLGDNSSRQPIPPGYTGAVPSPDPAVYSWQRVYGIPIEIDDSGVETVRQLLVGPVGPPPAVAIAGRPVGNGGTTAGVAIGASARARGRTSVQLTKRPGAK